MPEMRNRKDGAGPVKSLHQSLHGGGHLKPHKVERLDEAIDKSGGKSSKGTHLSMSGGKDEATDPANPRKKGRV